MGETKNNLKQLRAYYAGTYLLNRYFIKIHTEQRIANLPSYNAIDHTISDEDQLALQKKYFPILYHEYIHYIHEISTLSGTTQFYMESICRGIFSAFVNVPQNSNFNTISGETLEMYDRINETSSKIFGGTIDQLDDSAIYEIADIYFEAFKCYAPFHDPSEMTIDTTIIVLQETNSQQEKNLSPINFGKFYIYEGIAHHLQNFVAKHLGQKLIPADEVAPEYKILEMVSKFIFPTIDLRSMLELASISLSYWDCGSIFIRMLREAATVDYLPGYILEEKNKVSRILEDKREDFYYTLEMITNSYSKRNALHKSATHLCEQMKIGYEKRRENPTFEIEVTFSGRFELLAGYLKHCDLLYEFNDEDDYMRDFVGTNFNNEIAVDLKTFLCHVDYFQYESAFVQNHCCPLYTFCPHKIRQKFPEICSTQPRLAYEKSKVIGWCEYSLGVAYMKGEDK